MPLEQWLLLALFVLVALAQLLARWFTQVKGAGDVATPSEPRRRPDRTAERRARPEPISRGAPAPRAEPGRLRRPTATATPVEVHPPVRSRLGTLHEVRRGIVLMTVLGTCRALEPASLTPGLPERRTPREGHR